MEFPHKRLTIHARSQRIELIDGLFTFSTAFFRSVLLFPPVGNYRRYLIHQTCEKYRQQYDLFTFSVGQGPQRRTVLCSQKEKRVPTVDRPKKKPTEHCVYATLSSAYSRVDDMTNKS